MVALVGRGCFRRSVTPLHLHKCVARFVSNRWVSCRRCFDLRSCSVDILYYESNTGFLPPFSHIYLFIYLFSDCNIRQKIEYNRKKISPVGDWRSTSLEWPWPWPWFRPYGIQSCITHRPLPTYQISLRSEEKFFRRSPVRFWSSSESRDTKTRTNIENPARSNLDIVL